MSEHLGYCEHRISSRNTCPECAVKLCDRIKELEAENDRYRNGYKGGCWTCESVGELNVKLEAENQQLKQANEALHQHASHLELRCGFWLQPLGDGNEL